MSTTTHYPDQLMLPAQAAAPGGPVDMTMMYLMHHAFRRDLRKFADAVAATPLEEVATWQALAERWDRFFAILHHHHSGEDAAIWPYLMERATPEERATLEAMEEEHSHIDPLLTSCREGLAVLAGPPEGIDLADVRNALRVRMAATRDALSHHLRHEESEAMVILQRYMTQEDWEAIEREQFSTKEHPAKIPFMVCWLAEEMPDAEREQVFAEAGRPMKVLWLLLRRGWRRRELRSFRYVA